ADGRTALLAFTGQPALQRWDQQARPVPVSAVTAAQAALQQGATALVLDVAGPVLFVVESEDLDSLAAGDTLVPVPGGHAWVRPAP
ncbi:MAG: SseB family protein, partial [Nocardioidaceae bacterium]